MSKKKSEPRLRTFPVPEIDLEALRREMGHSASLHTALYVARLVSSDKPVDDEKESTVH